MQRRLANYIETEVSGTAGVRQRINGKFSLTLVYGNAMSPGVHLINAAMQRLLNEGESTLPAVGRGLEVRRFTR